MKSIEPSYIIVAGKQLPLIARKHLRARSMIVRYDAKHACVKVTLPRYVSLAKGLAFAQSKEAWIAAQVGKQRGLTLENGAIISLFGEEISLVHIGGRGVVSRVGNSLNISGDIEFLERRVRDFIHKEMQTISESRATFHAQKIGVKYKAIRLRDTTSRWGSCSISGHISLCWRLAFAPMEVLDYVIAHEIAHLKYHNHSKDFWNIVTELCPQWQQQEYWLKKNAQLLHLVSTPSN